jgi:putative cell wall-binding protein
MIASILAIVAAPASAGATVTLKRYSGIDRYATSAMAATGAFTTGTDAVVLVSGENYADGLSAAGLAGTVAGPVMLTHPTTLLGSTANAIGALDTGTGSAATKLTVHVVGGVNAVSEDVVTSLTGLGYTVNRISGADRYKTAVAVGDKIRSLTTIGSVVGKTAAILVSGNNFADGLAAGGLAYQLKLPIVLTDGSSLTAETSAFLDAEVNPAARVLIVGGTAAVSAAVATAVTGLKNNLTAIDVDRVSGADRYATALELAKYRSKATVLQGNNETVTNVMLVSGESFADALSSAAKAGTSATMTLLVSSTGLDAASDAWIATKFSSVSAVWVTGGTSAVSTAAATAAKTAGTTVKVTSTLTASKNTKCAVITYNSIMTFANGTAGAHGASAPGDGTGAADSDNYKLNNAQLVIDADNADGDISTVCGALTHDEVDAGEVSGLSCVNNTTAGTTKCYIWFGTALAVGDVLTVGSAASPASATGARPAVATGHPVLADATKATITWDPMIVGATTGTFSVSETVQVVDTNNTTNLTHDDVVCTEGTATALTQTNMVANTFMFTVSAFTAADTCSIAASAFMDVSGLAAPLVASTSGVSVSDTVGATLTAARTKTVNAGAITAAMDMNSGAGGTFKVAAKAAGAYTGPAGNAWSVQVIGATAGGTGVVTVFDVVTKKIVITVCIASCGTGVSPTVQTVVNALNAHSEFATNFVATVDAAEAVDQVVAATSLANGSTVYDMVISANEIMSETTDADAWDDASFTMDSDGAGTGTAGCAITQDAADLLATPNATDWYLKKLNVTCTATATTQLMSAGVSQIVSSAATEDFKGNVVAAAGRRVIISG